MADLEVRQNKKQEYRIAICDDDAVDRQQIETMTTEICRDSHINGVIAGFHGAEELLEELRQGTEYDLLLLDVVMPEKSGMELAEELRQSNMDTSIVFISSNRELALRGYEVAAARYLAKPLEKERLSEAVNFCFTKMFEESSILLPDGKGTRKILPREILYIETNGRKCQIVQNEEIWEVKMPMSELEKRLCSRGFIRCHQSYLVNFRYVRILHATGLELTTGKRLPISKHRSKDVRAWYFDQMRL